MTLAGREILCDRISAMGGRTRNFWERGLQKDTPQSLFQVKGGEQRENCEDNELPSICRGGGFLIQRGCTAMFCQCLTSSPKVG